MVIALLCLMVANARLMLAEFLVWFALSPFSSAPHFDGHQFSVHGASLTGPFNACAIAEPANAASTTPAMIDSFMTNSFPESISTDLLFLNRSRGEGSNCCSLDRKLFDCLVTRASHHNRPFVASCNMDCCTEADSSSRHLGFKA